MTELITELQIILLARNIIVLLLLQRVSIALAIQSAVLAMIDSV